MTIHKQHKRAVPLTKEHPLQRPKTLLQHLSSGIVHALPSLRSSSSKIDLIDRPATTSGPVVNGANRVALVAGTEQLPGSDSAPPCPYDPDSCHPFASIEKRRCSFCGMRGPKIVPHEPCHACKTASPGSHITFAGTHGRRSAVDTRHLTHLANSSDSVLLGPRPVTPERAAKRIGNPPQVSRLPPGIVRLPAPNAANTPACHESVESLPSRLGTGPSNRGPYTRLQGSHHTDVASSANKPTSPKLHHLSLLPHSENYPFVHRHEIPKHAIALRAGSSSPLTDRSNSRRAAHNTSNTADYSDTVCYGDRKPSLSSHLVDFRKPQTTTVIVKQVQASERASVDLYASPLDTALAESEVYKKRSPKQASLQSAEGFSDIGDSTTTFGSQDTESTKMGGMRLELKGGSFDANTSKLRGGSEYERASTDTFAFKLKRWILLCQPCHRYHDDSDDDLPPARVVTPERVAKMRQRMNGKAPLPAHLCIGTSSVTSSLSATQMPRVSEFSPTTAALTTTVSTSSKRTHVSCLSLSSLFHRRSDSPVNQPAPVIPAQILNLLYPQLRGGAESPGKVPPTLFWLAGGTGRKPISFSRWKQSRPRQRMGGLFGMAVFGDNYGQEYKVEARVVGNMEVECAASVKVMAEDEVGVKEGERCLVTSSPSSSPSSRAPSKLESTKEVAAVAVDVVSEPVVESAPRSLTPLSDQPNDDVPFCSGALPAEPASNASDDVLASPQFAISKDKAGDAAAIGSKKPHAS